MVFKLSLFFARSEPSDPVLRPEYGWTGDRTDFVEDGKAYTCSVCAEVVEIMDYRVRT